MDSFELNKILGAILGTCLVLLVTSFAASALFAPVMPEKPGYEIAVKEEAPSGGKEAAPPPSEPIEKLLQTASVEKGAAAAKASTDAPARPASSSGKAPAPSGAPAGGELDSARLVALNMALNGESRTDAERYLAEHFELIDRQKLVDEVYAAIEG